jgi:hypothetical protein
MSYVLGKNEATWGMNDGVYSYQDEILGRTRINGRVVVQSRVSSLPSNAKIVVFHGRHDPWETLTQRVSPWIKEHYQ